MSDLPVKEPKVARYYSEKIGPCWDGDGNMWVGGEMVTRKELMKFKTLMIALKEIDF